MSTVSYTTGFELPRPVDEVFPLFSAEGEKDWVPGWDYENVMGTTELSEDYVFLTGQDSDVSKKTIWIVKNHDAANYRVQFYRIEPGNKVGLVTVRCEPVQPESTRVEVTYQYTGISDQGNEFVENYSQQEYEDFIGEWRTYLLEFFDG